MQTAQPYLPKRRSLKSLERAVQACQGCELFRSATQAVFGRGPRSASMMLVGEAPGDQEDIQGAPFVGPAGRLLNEALALAAIDPDQVYVTNAVKHFKWHPSGKRRLHAKPSSREIFACRPWLEAEIEVVAPEVIVCLGATAAQTLLGRDFRLTKQRGERMASPWAKWIVATYHPSALLRAPDTADRQELTALLVQDLKTAAQGVLTSAR